MKGQTMTTDVRTYKKVYESDLVAKLRQALNDEKQQASDEYARIVKTLSRKKTLSETRLAEIAQAIKEEFHLTDEEVDEREREISETKDLRENMLHEMAKKIKLRPPRTDKVWYRVYREYLSNFSSQTQPHMYARSALIPLAKMLEELKFKCHIRFNRTYVGRRVAGDFYECGDYQLWSNAAPWQADAANRRVTLDFALQAQGRVVNPFVAYPSLQAAGRYDIMDQHYWKSGDQYQLITKV